MITIRCSRCRTKIFRYVKLGKGKVLRCYKDRLEADHSVRRGDKVYCPCGNLVGVDEGRWIKMVQGAFTDTGRITGK